MSIVAKTKVVVKTPTLKGNPFYGDTTTINTYNTDYVMDKFDGVDCPNNGIEVEFKFGDYEITLSANRYAFCDKGNGLYELLVTSRAYMYEIDIYTDYDGNIDMGDCPLVVNVYTMDDIDGDPVKRVKADVFKVVD